MAKQKSSLSTLITLPASINNQSLFSTHYLTERLPTLREWNTDLTSLFTRLTSLYAKSQAVTETWNEAQTENEFIRPMLDALGWNYIPQVSSARGGKRNVPDYALFADEKTKNKSYSLQKSAEEFYPLALAICDAKYWGRSLDAESPNDSRDTLTNANPSFQIINYLVVTDRPWGVLTNGKVWRLYAQRVRSRTTTFFEVDLSAALDAGDEIALRLFALLFRREAFQVDPASGKSFLDRVLAESIEYAVKVQDELKELVFERVAPLIVWGFVSWRHNEQGMQTETPETLATLYKAALVVLYRLLFLFYAESRNLLPVRDASGYGQLSLEKLCRQIAEQMTNNLPFGERTTLIWDRLNSVFRIIAKGDPSLRVPVYNGGLFADKPLNGTVTLQNLKVSDLYLAEAMDLLARRYEGLTEQRSFIDYKDLDVRHLGSIYEGLLEFQPRIATEDLAIIREKGREVYVPAKKQDAVIRKGDVYLANDRGQRKSTGSYYTPDYVVKQIVANTLGPVLAECEARFREQMAELEKQRRKLAKAPDRAHYLQIKASLDALNASIVSNLLDIRVCDPAMGSGHFLVEVVGYLTDRFAVLLAEHPANPLVDLIKQVREQILENLRRQGIEPDAAQLDDKHLLKRMVIKRCVYGVDLNPMAVELAKLALWLDSFTIGAPLSFLDHHLRHGNSVTGTRAEIVQRELGVATTKPRALKEGETSESFSQGHLFGSAFAGMLQATLLMRDVAALTDATLEEVEQSAQKYSLFEREILPYKRVMDIWVSRHFGVQHAEDFLRLYGKDALQAVTGGESRISSDYRKAIAQARALYDEQRFFHWDLEFPEVFVDLASAQWKSGAGFDAIVSNPPYVDVSPDPYFRKVYQCASSGNLYAYMLESCSQLITPGGRFGMIAPLSLVCSTRMAKLREWCARTFSSMTVANFGIRPAKIFPNVDQRTTIVLAQSKTDTSQPFNLKSTRLMHWHEGQELQMIASLEYADITDLPHESGWPKLGGEISRRIAQKLFAQKSRIGDYLNSKWPFYYHGIGRYWLKAYDFAPAYSKGGQPGRSTTLFDLSAQSAEVGWVILAILNSTLFFWYWNLYSDDFHLMREEIASFLFTYNEGHKEIYAKIQQKAKTLMRDYKKHSVIKHNRYATGEVAIQEFYPRKSKAIIDEIDNLLGILYGLSKKEVEYIKSYDIEFRTDEEDE